MKIAYLASIKPRHDGVSKKILIQMTEWQRLGHEVHSFFMSRSSHPDFATYRLWPRFNLFNPCFSIIISLWKFHPDIIYMREDNLIILRFFLLILFRNKIIIEINSDAKSEDNLIQNKSIIKKLGSTITNIINNISYKTVFGLIFVTHELSKADTYKGCRNFAVIPNASIGKSIIKKKKTRHPPIRLLFLGSPNQPWHGIDKMVYLAKMLSTKIELHLVGPSMQDIAYLSPSKNIITYGYCENYQDIAKQCHIAIGTLALHRKNMNEACPLKVREYIDAGFPIIIGYTDTAFIDKKYDFILQIENKEDSINKETVEKIYEFCTKECDTILDEKVSYLISPQHIESKRISAISQWLAESRSNE